MEQYFESDSVLDPVKSDITISWENVTVCSDRKSNFFVKNIVNKILRISTVNDESIKILDSVTGDAESGSLVAIMGPSGGGKTTLLAALARRIKLSSGCIMINGCKISRNGMSKIAGYLPQFDALPSSLTAMEYMTFTCALRLDKKTPSKERNILATNLFVHLGLLDSGNTFISKLSGGEAKRLALAIELVTKPKILFLDEPTSGLDTFTAMRVIESAKAEARNGTLVFCSIHQPAMDLYKMFSHVILLANGKTAYSGTLANATKFFNRKGFHCPESFNEAEYYVKVVSSKNLLNSLNENDSSFVSESSAEVCEPYPNSMYWKEPKTTRRHGITELYSQTCKPNQFVQFYWVSWRILVQMRRTMFQGWIDHFIFLMSAVLICMFYYGINARTQSGIQDIRGALYLVSSEIIYGATYSVLYVLPHEIPIYLRENSMYNPTVYYIGTALRLIPKAVLKAFVLFSIMFLAMDLNASSFAFVQFVIFIILASVTSSAYGMLVSSWIESTEIAVTIMAPIDLISFTMAGIFYNIRSMPAYLSWMKYLSIFYYTTEAFAIIQWTTVDYIEMRLRPVMNWAFAHPRLHHEKYFEVSSSQKKRLGNILVGPEKAWNMVEITQPFQRVLSERELSECYPDKDLPCLKNGREVLAQYGYDESNLWIDACGLGSLTLVMHILGYLGVKRRRVVKSMY